ncbi:MAG: VWA domain-containing protein [Proteobacteria bacterium]|nr:VWA domain-containing protein [Pseudomonadota bacterium]
MRKILTPVIFPIILGLSACSFSEEIPPPAEVSEEDAAAEQIVVTGSKIPSQDLAANSSIVVIPTNQLVSQAEMRARFPSPQARASGFAFSPSDQNPPNTYQDVGRDNFKDFEENPVKLVSEEPVSTFSIDVDTASYSFMRRQINYNVLPQKDAIRVEELINYFDYQYPEPEGREVPFRHTIAVTSSPWKQGNKLIHIGIKGYELQEMPRSNLVFLLDVSGSMNHPDKLPLMINSMKLLINNLRPEDTVAIVVYAGAAGTVLEPTKVSEKGKIIAALERLNAGGSTAGGEGLRLAYQLAEQQMEEDAVNRIILATDGDFNVGITNPEELKDFVERKRKTGIYLSVLGFGQGNYNDLLMQELAQNGNGVAAYIDNLNEARKVLVVEATSTLFPIAQDVKIQIEFNPAIVAEYRLVGYETRHLDREDFNNDAVDAGDIGSGHTVTAIYEITPVGGPRVIDESRYQGETVEMDSDFSDEYAFLKMRYKLPGEDTSQLITTPITKADEITEFGNFEKAGTWQKEIGFATAVASFGQLLKGGQYTGTMTYDDVIKMALATKGLDEFGYRAEFINLVRLTKTASALQTN